MPNSNSNNNSMNRGGGQELRYDSFFPQNGCMFPVSSDLSKCPKYAYPLQGIPTCSQPCLAIPDTSIYGTQVAASEIYGDALSMDGGDGIFYYNVANGPNSISTLTYPNSSAQYQHRFSD